MISHFQWKEVKNNLLRREWDFSFYYSGIYFKGTYHKDGSITWTNLMPENDQRAKLETQIHDLMLFHVYEDH